MTFDDSALHIAKLGGRPRSLDLHLLNEVDAHFGARDSVARARRIHAVNEKLVLARSGAECRHRRRRGARGRSGRDAWGGPHEVEHTRATRGNRPEVLETKAGCESDIAGVETRARRLDNDRVGHAGDLEDDRPLKCPAWPDADVLDAQGRETLADDFEGVRSRCQRREPQVTSLVGRQARHASDQCRRAQVNQSAGNDPALVVLDRADEGAGQALGERGCRRKRYGHNEQQAAPQHESRRRRGLGLHVRRGRTADYTGNA